MITGEERRLTDPPRRRRGLPGAWLLVLGVVVAAVTAAGIPAHATYGARVTADEPQYLLSALSLFEDHDLDIADELAEERYRPFHSVDLPRQTYPDDEGRELSPHDPLLAVLLAVPVGVGGWAGAKAALAAMAGVLAALTAWVAVHRFGVRPRWALVTVGVFACSAPLAPYATQVYPELPAALAVVAAVAAVSGRLERWGVVVAAGAVVALPWLSAKYAPVAVVLAAMALWSLRTRPRALAGLLGVLVAAGVAYLLVHRQLYGGWTSYAAGDHFRATGEASVMGSPDHLGRSRRLVGLLVDRTFGLAAWSPLWLVAVPAVGALVRRRPPGTAALLLPVAAGWLVASFAALTMHGWWWPGRQVVVVLPLVVVAVAWALDRIASLRPWALVAGALSLVTWAWTTTEAVLRRRVLVVDFAETANPWYRLWHTVLPDGRADSAGHLLLTVAWAVVIAGGGVLGWHLGGRATAVGAATSHRWHTFDSVDS